MHVADATERKALVLIEQVRRYLTALTGSSDPVPSDLWEPVSGVSDESIAAACRDLLNQIEAPKSRKAWARLRVMEHRIRDNGWEEGRTMLRVVSVVLETYYELVEAELDGGD